MQYNMQIYWYDKSSQILWKLGNPHNTFGGVLSLAAKPRCLCVCLLVILSLINTVCYITFLM